MKASGSCENIKLQYIQSWENGHMSDRQTCLKMSSRDVMASETDPKQYPPQDLGVCNDFTKRKCGFRKPRSYLAARLSACIRIPNDMDGEGFAATMIEIQLPSISCRQGRWIPHAWLHLFLLLLLNDLLAFVDIDTDTLSNLKTEM